MNVAQVRLQKTTPCFHKHHHQGHNQETWRLFRVIHCGSRPIDKPTFIFPFTSYISVRPEVSCYLTRRHTNVVDCSEYHRCSTELVWAYLTGQKNWFVSSASEKTDSQALTLLSAYRIPPARHSITNTNSVKRQNTNKDTIGHKVTETRKRMVPSENVANYPVRKSLR